MTVTQADLQSAVDVHARRILGANVDVSLRSLVNAVAGDLSSGNVSCQGIWTGPGGNYTVTWSVTLVPS